MSSELRVGLGMDAHAFSDGVPLVLGGVAIEAAGVCIEVSSAGLHKPVGELYPDPPLLEACHARGVPITLASDAHVPRNVGRDLDHAVGLARAADYGTVTVFDRRERRQEPLG
jgi:histidinol-phosphatase (PHP family)